MTVLINAGRKSGKTREALRWLKDNPQGVLYCINEAEASRLREIVRSFPASKTPEGRVISDYAAIRIRSVNGNGPEDFIRDRGRMHSEFGLKVAIDNLDLFLTQHFNAHIDWASVAGWSVTDWSVDNFNNCWTPSQLID